MTTDLKHALIKLNGCFSVLFSIFTCKQTSTSAHCKSDVELFCPVSVQYVGCGLCGYVCVAKIATTTNTARQQCCGATDSFSVSSLRHVLESLAQIQF